MDAVLKFESFSLDHGEEGWEETARHKLEAMVVSGNKNAKEAVDRLDGWRRRRTAAGIALLKQINHSDILMRIQVRELSDLARMGIEPAIRSLERIRVAKLTGQRDVKQTVDEFHKRLIGEFAAAV